MFLGGISIDGKISLVCIRRAEGTRGQGSLSGSQFIIEILDEHVVGVGSF